MVSSGIFIIINSKVFSALVSGFINLPSVMLPDSVEVLFTLIEGAKEVCTIVLAKGVEY